MTSVLVIYQSFIILKKKIGVYPSGFRYPFVLVTLFYSLDESSGCGTKATEDTGMAVDNAAGVDVMF